MSKHVKKVLKKRNNDDLSFLNFQNQFNTDDACRERLFKLRWPNGFICKECGHTKYYFIKGRQLYQCAQCKKQHSLTAGTLFQDTHMPLLKWFWAIYLVSRDKRGISALALKNAIHVSYQTAWELLHKIRRAMADKDQEYVLEGTVIVDDAYFGSPTKDKKRGRGTEKILVLVAVSIDEKSESPLFSKMSVIENMKDTTVKNSIADMVELNSSLRTDAHRTLINLDDFKHQVVNMSKENGQTKKAIDWVHVVISNAKAYILGTYHGLPAKYLQRYLDEFCYRLNRRFCESMIFDKLVNACFLCRPIPIAECS
jgi:transposase-like protein